MKRTILSLIIVAVACLSLSAGCARPAPTNPATVEESQQQVNDLKSRLEAAQEELDSYRLREQNWDYWQKVSGFLQKTLTGVSQTRGLSAPGHIEFRVVTVDWAKKKWGDDYVRDNARKIEIDERIYKALFVLPETASLAALYAAWPRSYLAATMGDKVYFIQKNFGVLSGEDVRKVLSHEVVHLLQSSHFETPELPTYDQDKARSGLTEGDADFTRAMYLAQIAGEKPPDFGRLSGALPGATPEPERPMAFTRLLYFSYDYGQSFISALYQKGGWQQVNGAFQKPPETTQQVMHPEKYLAGKGPESFTPLPLNIAGWQEGRVDRLGEHFIKTMLEAWIGPQAAAAAQGWAGDRLTYYEQQQAYLFTWQTLWDSSESATRFYQAFLTLLDRVGATQVAPGLWLGRGEYVSVGKPDSRGVLIIASKERGIVDAALAAVSARR